MVREVKVSELKFQSRSPVVPPFTFGNAGDLLYFVL